MRIGEVDGRDYHFIDVDQWTRWDDAQEWILPTMFDNHYYGYRASALRASMHTHQYLLLNIDQEGAKALRGVDPGCINILLTASSEQLQLRLHRRGETMGSRRFKEQILWDTAWYHYHGINDNVDACVRAVDAFIKTFKK